MLHPFNDEIDFKLIQFDHQKGVRLEGGAVIIDILIINNELMEVEVGFLKKKDTSDLCVCGWELEGQ